MVDNSGGNAAPEKKSRKSLPSVDADQVETAEVNTEAAKPLEVGAEAAKPVVEDSPAAAAAPSPEVAVLKTQLAEVKQTARVSLGVAAVALVAALSAPWWVPHAIDNDATVRGTAALGAAQLRALASQSTPFGAELALVSHAMPTDKATKSVLATIEPLAQAGVPTLAALKDSFRGTADAVLVGQVVNKDDESWVRWGLHKVAALVRFETVVSTVATPPADVQIVHLAEVALSEDNLALAIEHLSKLDGNSANEVQGWLADARNRVALDAAIAKLGQQVEARTRLSAWLWLR